MAAASAVERDRCFTGLRTAILQHLFPTHTVKSLQRFCNRLRAPEQFGVVNTFFDHSESAGCASNAADTAVTARCLSNSSVVSRQSADTATTRSIDPGGRWICVVAFSESAD